MFSHREIEGVSRLLHGFKSLLSREFQELGIDFAPTQMKVLRLVAHNEPCTSQELAGIIGRDKAQVTRLLQEMLNKGVIERAANPNDKRSQLLSVTETGTAALQVMEQAEQKVLAQLSQGLEPGEIAQFSELLERINSVLAQ